MKRENIYNKSIPKYSSVNIVLKHFNIHEKQLENILLEMEKNQRLAYTYYYGINRPKLDLEDISEMLHVSENVVKIYINQADDFIQRFCQNITVPIPGVVENKGRRTKNKKISFFDYFDEKDKPLILEIIEEYKEKDSDYYEILVKACGEKYDHLVLSTLTKKEKIKLNNFRAIIKNKIKNGKLPKKTVPIKKQNFFDYFEEKDKPLVLKVIEEYKEKDSDYYKVLIKEYGEKYDSLVDPSLLTEEEKIKLNNFRAIIRSKIKSGNFSKKSGRTKKQSFFDYFDEKDKDFVLKIIEEYKEKDSNYYKVLIKEYGEKYNSLVEPSLLTKEEKTELKTFRAIIRSKIKSGNFSKKSGRTKKQSFFDYFDEKDKPLVLKVIEEYKEKDSDYYKVLIKEYGEKYDSLVDPSLLTEEEKIKLNNFRAIIRSKIKSGNFSKKSGRTKKQSFFDYFDEKDKDFVLKIIEEYKEKDSDYYKVLVKTYGEKYDCLVLSSLTKKEKNQLRDFKKVIEKKLQKGTLKSGRTKKQSFFDYFEEKDKPLVLKIIEKYKEKDSDYYKVLVKTYGEKYDHLILPSLTEEEKIKLNSFRAIIRSKIERNNFSKKPGPIKKQSFFDYFEEKDKPLVLEIIEEYKEKDSDYYKVLIKEYGEQYDSLVVPSLLNDREKNRLRDFKSAIREKLQDIKSTKNQTLQNEDFNYDLSMSYIYRRFPNLKQEKEADLIILTSFINKKKSVESISALTKFPIKKIDFILLKHLYVFSFKTPEIIEDILRRGSYTVSQIVNFNYIQTQVPFLNDKEKELLYLKMVELYQNQLSDVLKFSDKEMKHKIKTLKFKDFN